MKRSRGLPLVAVPCMALFCLVCGCGTVEKSAALRDGPAAPTPLASSLSSAEVGGAGYRTELLNGAAVRVPLVVVGGTPYQMGWHLGRLMQKEIQAFIPAAVAGMQSEVGLTDGELDTVWATTAAYTDDRLEQELLGLADGSGVSLRALQRTHCLPLLMPYSCSSIAAWGAATADGHLYQTRNLDWSLELGAHRFPVVVVYLPDRGTPHVIPSFAGFIGAHCGMNTAGIVLSEMGDSPEREMPYNLRAPHFTAWFRTLLYDSQSLTEALATFRGLPMTKRYHFLFGDGRTDKRAVKIRAHSPEPPDKRIIVWSDNDPDDELAPDILPRTVYADEGRGAFPTLEAKYGKLDPAAMMDLCNRIPIKGSNVVNIVFDATALRLWVSYAGETAEAYRRPYVFADLTRLDGDADGIPDLQEGVADTDADGKPDFLDP